MRKFQLLFTFFKVPIDFAMTVMAFLLAYQLRLQNVLAPEVIYVMPLPDYFHLVILVSIFWVIVFALTGMYSSRSDDSLWLIFNRVFVAVSVSLAIFIIVLFGFKETFFSRLIAAYAWAISIVLICFGRVMLIYIKKLLAKWKIASEQIVIIGNNKVANELSVFYQEKMSQVFMIDPKMINNSHLSKLINRNRTDQIILTSELPLGFNLDLINFCETNGIKFRYLPNLVELYSANASIGTVRGYPLIELRPTPLDGWGRIVKRLFDFMFSALALIILSPVMILVAILVRLDSLGPALFVQKRPGQFGHTFNFYKFRSMYTHLSTGGQYGGHQAEKFREQLKATHNEASGPMFKMKNDPRITKFGRFIRKTSLDELPQLFNVFNGEMSLVGPRPPLLDEVAQYNKKQFKRLLVKPGMTGMWQVSGRSDTSFEEYLRLDMYYIEHWSLWLDIQIILKTVWMVIAGKGAY